MIFEDCQPCPPAGYWPGGIEDITEYAAGEKSFEFAIPLHSGDQYDKNWSRAGSIT